MKKSMNSRTIRRLVAMLLTAAMMIGYWPAGQGFSVAEEETAGIQPEVFDMLPAEEAVSSDALLDSSANPETEVSDGEEKPDQPGEEKPEEPADLAPAEGNEEKDEKEEEPTGEQPEEKEPGESVEPADLTPAEGNEEKDEKEEEPTGEQPGEKEPGESVEPADLAPAEGNEEKEEEEEEPAGEKEPGESVEPADLTPAEGNEEKEEGGAEPAGEQSGEEEPSESVEPADLTPGAEEKEGEPAGEQPGEEEPTESTDLTPGAEEEEGEPTGEQPGEEEPTESTDLTPGAEEKEGEFAGEQPGEEEPTESTDLTPGAEEEEPTGEQPGEEESTEFTDLTPGVEEEEGEPTGEQPGEEEPEKPADTIQIAEEEEETEEPEEQASGIPAEGEEKTEPVAEQTNEETPAEPADLTPGAKEKEEKPAGEQSGKTEELDSAQTADEEKPEIPAQVVEVTPAVSAGTEAVEAAGTKENAKTEPDPIPEEPAQQEAAVAQPAETETTGIPATLVAGEIPAVVPVAATETAVIPATIVVEEIPVAAPVVATPVIAQPTGTAVAPAAIQSAAPADNAGNGAENGKATPSLLQSRISEILKEKKGTDNKLSGHVQIALNSDTTYEGEVEISTDYEEYKKYTFADDFELELTTKDAGEDGLQADGTTKFAGTMVIRGISVIIKGIGLPGSVSVSGEKAKLDYYGSAKSDTVNITASNKAEVSVRTGDDADTVKVTADTGAKAEIHTDTGDDTVTAAADGAAITIETGADKDQVAATVANGGSATIETGAGDDTVALDVRAGTKSASVSTGTGDDAVTVKNGSSAAADNLSEAIAVDLGDGINTAEIDLSLADVVTRVTVEADEESSSRVHLTGTLKTDSSNADYNPISGTAENLHLTKDDGKVLNVTTKNIASLTDALANKRTRTLTTSTGSMAYTATDAFTNYLIKIPQGNLGNIRIATADGKPLLLSTVLISTDTVLTGDDAGENKLTVGEGSVVSAVGLGLILRARQIAVNGRLEADLIQMEATDGTGKYGRSFSDLYSAYNEEAASLVGIPGLDEAAAAGAAGLSMAADLLNINDEASIEIGEKAEIYSAGDVNLLAEVEQSGSIVSLELMKDFNLVNVKLASAKIDIAGKIYAGYDFAKNTVAGNNGSVRAKARISTSIGYDAEGKEQEGLPLAVSVAVADAAVNVAKGAEIRAAGNIALESGSALKIHTRADSGKLSSTLPVALAVSVLVNDAETTVDGTLNAGRNVKVGATADTQLKNIADKGGKHDNASGGYIGVSVVLQDAKAVVGESGTVTAGGDVKVISNAVEKVVNTAASSTQQINKSDDGFMEAAREYGVNLLTDKVFPWLKEKLKETWKGKDAVKAEELEKALGKIAGSNKAVELDEKAGKHGDVKVGPTEGGKAEVTVTPSEGYKVRKVWWRGYNAGSSSYTVEDITSTGADGKYTLQFKAQFVTLFVEYEEEDGTAVADDLFDDDGDKADGDDSLDLEALLNDVQNGTGDKLRSMEDLKAEAEDLEEAELRLTAEGGGAVLNHESDPNDPTKSLARVVPGQDLRLIPNPSEGKALRKGGLIATYKVKEDDKEVTKTVIINEDEKGRYIFRVPEDMIVKEGLTIKASFVNSDSQDAKADTTQTQVTGAISVVVANNDSDAVIEAGAKVTAGRSTAVEANTTTDIATTADGTGASKQGGGAGGEKKANYAIKRDAGKNYSGFDAAGREYGLRMEKTGNGTVTFAPVEMTNNQYTFTVTPDAGYVTAGATLTYYVDGAAQKMALTADGNTYTVNLNSITGLDKGSISQVNFVFAKEGAETTESGAPEAVNIIPNPIKIAYNGHKKGSGSDETFESIGKIYYKSATTDADGHITGYVFTASPEATYVLDGKLKASWTDLGGGARTRELEEKDGEWILSTTGITPGALITVSGTFKDDLHDFTAKKSFDNGKVTLYDQQIKATDKPKMLVEANPGYSVSEITVSYTGRDGTSVTTELTLTGKSITPVKDKDGNPIDGLYEFTLPDNVYAGSEISVTATFNAKTIGLYNGKDKDSKDVKLSESYAAIGDKITVSPVEEKLKAGYKVTKVTVTDAAGKEVASGTDSFTIPDDKGIAENAKLTVTATIALKAIELTGAEMTGGKLSPASARADLGDIVTVNVSPDSGYRVKTGTLKAVIRGKSGTYSSEQYMNRKDDTTYTFLLPSDIDVAGGVEITFAGEFVPGQSDNSAYETSLGTGIAVTVANAKNRGLIEGTVESGGNVSVKSVGTGSMKTEAKAGYSKTATGFAGAIAVQVASNDSRALIDRTAAVKLDGELKMSAEAKSTFAVTGDASGSKEAGKTGIGAGVAVGVNGSAAVAAVQDGAALANRTAGKNIRGISISAAQEVADSVSAKAGAAGGTAVVPVAAVDVTGSTTTAYLGKTKSIAALALGDASDQTGTASISATGTASHAVTADASASGQGAGIGVAIAVSVVSDEAEAKLKESLDAQNVNIAAETVTNMKETATASASGGEKSGDSADEKADGLMGTAGKLAGKNGSSAVSAKKVDNAAASRQKAETSEGTVGVAGAVAVNVQDSVSRAEIADAVNVSARGNVTVTAVNGTTVKVKANAATTNSDIGVGVGAAVNVIALENIARLGNGEIKAAMLKVSATTKETKPADENKVIEKVENVDDLAEQIGKVTEEYINDLIAEMGLDQYGISEDLLGEIAGEVAKEVSQTLIEATGLDELLGDGDLPSKYNKALEIVSDTKDGILGLPEKLADPFMEAISDAYDLSQLSGEDWADLKDQLVTAFRTNLVEQLKASGMGVVDSVKDGVVEYLKDNAGELISGAFTGEFKKNVSKIFKKAKEETVKAVKKQLKNLVVNTFRETVKAMDIPGVTAENADLAVDAFKGLKNAYDAGNVDNILTSLGGYVSDTIRTEVFDYEQMLTTLSETDFSSKVADTLRAAAKKASVTLTNSAIAALTDHFDLKLEGKSDPTGHVISTQAVAGAGARDVGVAGSVAVTVLNAETSATVAESSKEFNVGGDVTVEAKELRSVESIASAALDANGDADANKSADEEANADVAAGNNTVRGKSVTLELGAGATGEIRDGDKNDNRPKIYVDVEEGYKMPSTATYSYTGTDGKEKSGTIAVMRSGNRYVVDPMSGDLKDVSEYREVRLKLEPEEILHAVPTPDASLSDTKLEPGAVTVSVKGREAKDGKISARLGEQVEIRIDKSKIENGKVQAIGYSYKDAQGKIHDVEINPAKDSGAGEKAYTLVTSNEKEIVYTITMPDADIDAIVVSCVKKEAGETEENAESQTKAKDGKGKTVGVGAAFSLVYGDTETVAQIGKRGSVKAGALTVDAASEHSEKIASAAGSDPLEGALDADATKDFALDASVALNILDTGVRAEIAGGMYVNVTEGDLKVTAEEEAETETTASAFSVGESTAVGAGVAVNIANSAADAKMLADAKVAGAAEVRAASHSEDVTKAIATAMGGDIGRTMAKIGDKADSIEEGANKVLDGSYVDSIGKDDKKTTETGKKINERLEEKNKQTGGKGDETKGAASTSTNVLRSLGVSTESEDAGLEATSEAKDKIEETTGTTIGDSGEKTSSKIQVGAAVGVTVASHEAHTQVGGITAGGEIKATAENTGNFNTMGTGAAMSLAKKANSIALGVAVSVNANQATVDVAGDQVSENNSAVTLASTLTQNMDGDFRGKLAAQSLSGSVAGAESTISLAGAVSVVVAQAESSVKVSEGRTISGGDVAVEATDKSKLAARAGGLSISKGSSVGMGIASTSVISSNRVNAEIGNRTSVTADSFRMNAEKKAVTDDDFEQLIDMRYLVTDSSALDDEQRKEANTGLIDLHKGEDDDSYKVEINLSEEELLDAVDALNFLSSQNTYAEAIAGSVATGSTKLNLAGSFAVAVTDNEVTALLGDNVSITTRKGNADLTAKDGATTRIIAGSLSAAPAKVGVGATVAVLINSDSAEVKTGEQVTMTTAGDLTLAAEQTGDTQVFTGAMSVAAGKDAGTSIGGAINVIVNKSEAKTDIGENAEISADGSANISSKAKYDLTLISGSASVSAGQDAKVAAGGTVNVIVDKTVASTSTGDLATITAMKDLSITSDVSDQMISGALSASAAISGSGKSGAGAVNVMIAESAAKTDIGKDAKLDAAAGDMKLGANNDAWMLNATMAAAGSNGAAIGGAFNVNVFDRTAELTMQDGKMNAGGNLYAQASGRDTTIMAALALSGSLSGLALSGSVDVIVESNRIRTDIAKGVTAKAMKDAVIESYFSDYMVDAAGSIAASGSSTAIGATAVTVVKSNTVETKLAESEITGIGGGGAKALNGDTADGVYIGANAAETQFLGAAGIAASAGGTAINGVVDVMVNSNTVIADASKATLDSTEEFQDPSKVQLYKLQGMSKVVPIALKDITTWRDIFIAGTTPGIKYRSITKKEYYEMITGISGGQVTVTATDDTRQILLAGGVSASSGSGVGAAVVTLVSGKDVKALANEMTACKDIAVNAMNRDDVTMLAISAGLSGGVGVQIGAAVQVLKSKATAEATGTVKSEEGSISITTDNETQLKNIAAAAALAGGAAVTPAAVVTYFTGESNATLKNGSTADAAKDVNIKAQAKKEIDLYSAGASIGGGVGVSGTANVIVSKDKTQAKAEAGTEITSDEGGLNIEALSEYKLTSATAALAGGAIGVAVNAVVSVIKSDTTAELAGKVKVEKDVNVKASGSRNITNIGANLAAGAVGAGVNVMVLVAGEKMSQDAADMLSYGDSKDKSGDKTFDASTLLKNIAVGDGGGSQYYQDDLNGDILAEDTAGNGHYESKTQVGGTSGSGDEKQGTFDAASGYRSSEFDDTNYDDNGEKQRGENLEAKDTTDIANAKKLNVFTNVAPEDAVIARITEDAVIENADNVNVTAEQPVTADLYGLTVGAGAVGVGVSAAVAMLHSNVSASSMGTMKNVYKTVNVKAESKSGGDVADRSDDLKKYLKDLNPANGGIRAIGATIGGGAVSVAVGAAVVLTDNRTQAVLGGMVEKAKTVSVDATQNYGHVTSAVGSLSGGAVAVAASVAVAQSEAVVTSKIADKAKVTASGDVNVTSTGNQNVTAIAATASAGAVSANAGVALAINRMEQNTGIGSGAKVTANNITVKAGSDTTADSALLGVSLGGVGVSLGAAVSQVDAKVNTRVEHATLKAKKTIDISNDVVSTSTPKVVSLAGGGIAAGGNVLLAFNETESDVRVSGSTVQATTLNVVADLQGKATSELAAAQVGGISVGLSVNYADMQADNRAVLENSTVNVQDLLVSTGHGDHHNTSAVAKTVAGGMGFIAVNMNAAIARNNTKNYAVVDGGSITAANNFKARSFDIPIAAASVSGTNAGALSVAINAVVALNDADTRAVVKLDKLDAGAANFETVSKATTSTSITTGGGALFKGDASVGVAYGRSASVVDAQIGQLNAASLTATTIGTDTATSKITNGSYGAIKATAMMGAAFSQDIFNTKIKLGNGSKVTGETKVATEYEITSDADVTPHKGGLDVSLLKLTVNLAAARNTAYAGSDLTVDSGTAEMKNVTVQTTGSGSTNAIIRPVQVEVSGVKVAANFANSDLSMKQAATLNLNGATMNAGDVSVKSVANKASSTASVGTAGASGISISLANESLSHAWARENMESTAGILGKTKMEAEATEGYLLYSTSSIGGFEWKTFRGSMTKEEYESLPARKKAWYSKVEPTTLYTTHATEANLNAGGVTVSAAMKDDSTQSVASATSNGAMNISFATLGNLESKAISTDSFSAMLQGLTVNATGDANIFAKTNTKSTAYGGAPGGYQVISGGVSNTYGYVGRDGDRQTAQVLLDENVKLAADNVNLLAQNTTATEAMLEKKGGYSIGQIDSSCQPTETWVNTSVIIGKNVQLTAKNKMDIALKAEMNATSKVDSSSTGLVLNVGTMKGRNEIHEDNDLLVGENTKMTSGGDMSLIAKTTAYMDARSTYSGTYSVFGQTQAEAQNLYWRNQNLSLANGVTATAGGTMSILSDLGTEDGIETHAKETVRSFIELAQAQANAYPIARNNINIGAVNLTSNGDMNITAQIGGYYYTRGDVDAADSVKLDAAPTGTSLNQIDMQSFVNINRENMTSRASLTSQNGAINVTAKTENLHVIAKNFVEGSGVVGSVDAHCETYVEITATIWADNVSFDGKNGTNLRTNFGDDYMAYFEERSEAALYGVGSETARSFLQGHFYSKIYTNDRSKVSGGNSFDHTASDKRNHGISTDCTGWATSIGYRENWTDYYHNGYCDFCNNDRTEKPYHYDWDIEGKLKAALKKALAPVNDINRQTNGLKPITKARYQEIDDKVSGAIYVLNLEVPLEKDALLSEEDLKKYCLWNNSLTGGDVWLLPNAAQLHRDTRLNYVSDVLRGHLDDGGVYNIEIYTALNTYAYTHPIIPIGSSGMLDFSTGVFTVPELADFELYLHEVSGKWMIGQFGEGTIRMFAAEQEAINDFALGGTDMLPRNREIKEGLTELGEEDGWKLYWLGDTPETVQDPDQWLICLYWNEETDEIDAGRITLNMLKAGEDAVDVSLYLFRDSKSDRQGTEKYNVLFFDTPEGQKSLVKVVTNVLEGRELVMPRPVRIVLRGLRIGGADLPVYSLADNYFAMNDGTDGEVSMFDGFYTATFDGDVFESGYTRIEGIRDNKLRITLRKGQPIWPEWTGEMTAEDRNGYHYQLVDEAWEKEEDMPVRAEK